MSSSATRTPISRKQLAEVFKDPRTLKAFEQMLDTFTNVQNGSLTFSSGDMKAFAGSVVPDGWLACDGSAVSRTLYADLFDVIGITWGAGNGTTTFNLPPSGVMFIGANATYPFGSTGGAATVVLTVNELPAHNHPVVDPGHTHNITDPGHTHTAPVVAGAAGNSGTNISVNPGNTGSATTGITINSGNTGITTSNTGSGAAVPTMSPYAAITWLIKA